MDEMSDAYQELYVYALDHGGAEFVLQYVVDAHMAQTAGEAVKPIAITFALVGLYLHLEKSYSGRQVQLTHMKLGKHRKPWPSIPLPQHRGSMTAADVMAAAAGPDRDRAIDAWCRSVWDAFHQSHETIARLMSTTSAERS